MKYSVSSFITEPYGIVEVWCRYQTRIIHRENDLPAKEWGDGGQEYYFNGKLHRTNGSAIVYPGYPYIYTYYYHGVQIFASSIEDFQKKVKLMAFS